MRIAQLTPDIDLYRGYCDDLARVLESLKRTDRPCLGCDLRCGPHKSPVCTCACTPDCTHALQQMSSEGERYPIEAGIAPLVQAFLWLREFTPCWSCEGHEATAGSEARPPRVIFYVRSNLYPVLIAETVTTLHFKKKLSCHWEVAATPIGNLLDMNYTLHPNLADGDSPTLCQLQADVRVIADNLRQGVLIAAHKYLAGLCMALRATMPQGSAVTRNQNGRP